MTTNWTENQQQAIEKNGGTILVSAAAGSGKTAVLVERIIKKITGENNIDVDKLLVVTFSNDAAKEMKDRISSALNKLFINNPNDLNLKRQQVLISRANISTVHSFCFDLIRNNYHALNLEPDFIISDSIQSESMKKEAMNKTLDDYYLDKELSYDKIGKKDLNLLLSDMKSDKKLSDAIETIYKYIISCPSPANELKKIITVYEKEDFCGTLWCEFLFEEIKNSLYICKMILNNILSQTKDIALLKEKYNISLEENIRICDEGLNCFSSEKNHEIYNLLYKFCCELSFYKMPIYRKIEYKELIDDFKNQIAIVQDEFKEIASKITFSIDEVKNDLEKNRRAISVLCMLTEKFKENYDALKREKNCVDFNDAEQFTLKLLIEFEGDKHKKTKLAKQISKQFNEIMVDEYQDTNAAQDLIFMALSNNENNIFMVGDAKQGIYRFRQANPEIFINKKEKFNKIEDGIYPAKIILNKNFRSRKEITNIINLIFSKIMTKKLGEITYNEEEFLNYGANYPENSDCFIDFALIENQENSKNGVILEAKYVAQTIKKMILNKYLVHDKDVMRPCVAKDFCIMMRSVKEHASIFLSELANVEIDGIADGENAFFQTKEINIAIALLETINNPLLDISLIATLMSPLFNFSATDISKIRNYANGCEKEGKMLKKSSVYLHLLNFIKDENSSLSKKVSNFIEITEEYRRLSAFEKTDILINKIFDDTNFYNIVSAMLNGDERLSNLKLFVSIAQNYEKNGYKGLSAFIRFVSKLQEEKGQLDGAATSKEHNAVRFLSIHKSKGLEFPFCFICGLTRKFNEMDLRNDIIINNKSGIGLKIIDEELNLKYKPLPFSIISRVMKTELKSEEIRILYVALTRAKEKLFFVASDKNILDKIEKSKADSILNDNIHQYLAQNKNNYFDWIMTSIVKHKAFNSVTTKKDNIIFDEKLGFAINTYYIKDIDNSKKNEIVPKEKENPSTNNYKSNNIIKLLSFTYPYKESEKYLSKISVSSLAKENNQSVFQEEIYVPNFEKNKIEKSNPIIKGNAVHKFLQIADFNQSKNNLNEYALNLVKTKQLSQQYYNSINFSSIQKFLSSNLAKEMINSKKIYKEAELLHKIKLKEIFNGINDESKNDEIIIQGIADCIFKSSSNMWILVDYKTDKLKNESEFVDRYKNQLLIYKMAAEYLIKEKIEKTIIYSFHLNKEIEIN